MNKFRILLKNTTKTIPKGQFRNYLTMLYKHNRNVDISSEFIHDWTNTLRSIVEQQSQNKHKTFNHNRKTFSLSFSAMAFQGFEFEEKELVKDKISP